MINEINRKMYKFETRNWSPQKVQKVATLLNTMVGCESNTQIIQEIQKLRLKNLIDYVYKHSPFYRKMFKRIGIHPADICSTEDLRKIPFTTSSDIREWREFVCIRQDKLSAVFATSGTTGEPKRIYYSLQDIQMLTNLSAVALRAVHPGQLIGLIALPMSHGLWIGSSSVQRGIERAGNLPLPVGADDPQETLKWIQRFEPNAVFSSPSYMSVLTREAERKGYKQKLDLVVVAGELLTGEHKKRFSEYWGAQIFDIYGSTEIGSAQTIALPGCTSFHLNDLHLVVEIVNPETGEPADEGELVFTTLMRDAMPLIRYKSGDRGRWSDCGCKLPFRAIQLGGRTDDMIIVSDIKLYGHIITETLAKVKGTTGRIAIQIEKSGLTDMLVLKVEGKGIKAEDVKQALFTAYPELKVDSNNGNLILVIETEANLGNQIKDLKIVDKRNSRGLPL